MPSEWLGSLPYPGQAARSAAPIRDPASERSVVLKHRRAGSRIGAALRAADEVFVLDVFAAREQPIAGVSGRSIAEHVSVPVHYVPDFSAVAEQVAACAEPGDVVVTMGAGDVTLLGREILDAVNARADGRQRR